MSVISRDDVKEGGISTYQLIIVGCSGGKQKMESENMLGRMQKRRNKDFTDKKRKCVTLNIS